jgi:hypothetical protein
MLGVNRAVADATPVTIALNATMACFCPMANATRNAWWGTMLFCPTKKHSRVDYVCLAERKRTLIINPMRPLTKYI